MEPSKERPILFSAPMVRAILEGRKTQTRRVVKRGQVFRFCPGGDLSREERSRMNASLFQWERDNPAHPTMDELLSICPYGAPGDRLWVREAWGMTFVDNVPAGRDFRKGGTWGSPAYPKREPCVVFLADGPIPPCNRGGETARPAPSIHMPRWACRTVLEIVSRRLERIGDISEDDAKAEGMRPFTKDGKLMKWWPCDPIDGPHNCTWQEMPRSAREALLSLFYVINERAEPDANPWVWVVEFKRVQGDTIAVIRGGV